MPNTELTIPAIQSEVRSRLGGSMVDLEFTDADITTAINNTVRTYNRYRERHVTEALAVSSSVKKYLIDKPNIQGVIDVAFVSPTTPSVSTPIDPFTQGTFNSMLQGGSVAEYQQTMRFVRQARKVVGTDPEWTGQFEADGKYYLYVNISRPYLCSYTYVWHINSDGVPLQNSTVGYGDYGLKHVDASDVKWFMDYTTAQMKCILGRVLRKFGGVPNSNDGQDPTDGGDLVNEGTAELQRLDEIIARRMIPGLIAIM